MVGSLLCFEGFSPGSPVFLLQCCVYRIYNVVRNVCGVNAQPHKRQSFKYHRVKIKKLVLVSISTQVFSYYFVA